MGWRNLVPRSGTLCVIVTATVGLFFGGLLELSKTLLDPFGSRRVSNAGFLADVQIDVLLAETNSGLQFWPERVEALAQG